jgi:translocation and assembly module TamB
VRARGSYRDGKVDATVEGVVARLRAGDDVSLGQGRVRGRIFGPPGALELDASVSGTDFQAGGYDFDRMTARAGGPITAPRVEAHLEGDEGDKVDARGQLNIRSGSVDRIGVEIVRAGQKVEAEIARVGPSRGGIAVEGVKIRGDKIGSVEGGLAVRNKDITGKLRGDGIDLGGLATLLGIPHRVRGIANLDISLERGEKGRSGHVLVELENGAVPLLPGISANWAASFQNDVVTAAGMVRLVAQAAPGEAPEERCDGTIAEVTFSRGEGHLEGPLLDPATWAGLTGSVHVEANDWNLRCLTRLLPIGLPVSELSGWLSTRLDILRDPKQRFPSVQDLVMHTRELHIAGRKPFGAEAPEWESRSIDGLLRGNLNGISGETELGLTLFDEQRLADLAVTAELDLPTLVDNPRRRWASLSSSKLSARLSTPRRALSSFSTLPAFLSEHLPEVAGDVELSGFADGTLDQPFFTFQAKGYGMRHAPKDAGEPSPWVVPVEVEALVTYDASGAPLSAQAVVARTGRPIARIGAEIETDLRELFSDKPSKPNLPGKEPPPRWTGGFRAELLGVPLGEIPFFADRDIAGNLSGTLSASGLNQNPSLSLKLDMPDLQLGPEVFLESGTVSLQIQPVEGSGRSRAFVTADILAQDGGRLRTNAYSGIVWRDKLMPAIDTESAADLVANLKDVRLAMLQPLVAGTLSKLDGQVNGTVRVGSGRLGDGEQGRVDAYMTVKQGVVHIPQFGQELRDASMTIISNPRGVVRFEKVEAKGVSGKIRGSALARFDGLRFKNAEGELVIARGDAIPLTLEGVPLGTAYGTLRFMPDPTQEEGEIALRVKVPSFHLQLPAASSRNVQSLEEHADFNPSHPLDAIVKKEEEVKDALRYRLTIDIGQMRVEGTGLDVTIASADEAPPRVVLHGETHVGGQIEIVRGKFEVFGKAFEIERGLVRMREEDTSNPYVNITAHWDAPDGTRVFVDFNGTLRPFTDDKLRFRSNPPRTDQEILAILLFGSDSASEATTPAGSTKTSVGQMAGGVAVDLAAAQVNALFAGTPFRAKVGTTEQGRLKTGVVYELGDTVTAGAAVEAPSADDSGGAEVNIDWRFKRNWTLRGSFGVGRDQPRSGVDVLWQYRY